MVCYYLLFIDENEARGDGEICQESPWNKTQIQPNFMQRVYLFQSHILLSPNIFLIISCINTTLKLLLSHIGKKQLCHCSLLLKSCHPLKMFSLYVPKWKNSKYTTEETYTRNNLCYIAIIHHISEEFKPYCTCYDENGLLLKKNKWVREWR